MEARRREHEHREEHEDRERRERRERLEPVERGEYLYETRMAGMPDLVHWGPVWAGLLGAFGVLIVLGLLGLAVGLGAAPTATPGQVGTSSAIWGVVITIVAFFVGGWLAGTTSPFRGSRFEGFLLGSMVWALGVVFAVLLVAIGVGGIAGASLSAFGGLPTPGPGVDAGAAQSAAIGSLIGIVLAYIACVIGSIVGCGTRAVEPRDYR